MIIKTSKCHNENGAKITATSAACQNRGRKTVRAVVPYNYAMNGRDNHIAAARKLAKRFEGDEVMLAQRNDEGRTATVAETDSVEQTGSHKTGYSFLA